ncbi:MAG: hypothetical protein J7J27_03230, partial [Euryarchaeota archaeon]|nr:hypothetical protein [Euryarchaeota archaeon]
LLLKSIDLNNAKELVLELLHPRPKGRGFQKKKVKIVQPMSMRNTPMIIGKMLRLFNPRAALIVSSIIIASPSPMERLDAGRESIRRSSSDGINCFSPIGLSPKLKFLS